MANAALSSKWQFGWWVWTRHGATVLPHDLDLSGGCFDRLEKTLYPINRGGLLALPTLEITGHGKMSPQEARFFCWTEGQEVCTQPPPLGGRPRTTHY